LEDQDGWSIDTKFNILRAAVEFELKAIQIPIRALIRRSIITPDNAIDVLERAHNLNDHRLVDVALNFIKP
jgi:hypothetical protein